MPDILITRSGFFRVWLCSPLENCPSIEPPRSRRTAIAVLSIKPSGETPALSAAMISAQECRATASAIWLRTQLPTHTKSTFTNENGGLCVLACSTKADCARIVPQSLAVQKVGDGSVPITRTYRAQGSRPAQFGVGKKLGIQGSHASAYRLS